MRFADLTPGRTLSAGPASLDEASMVAFAQQWDPQWFHVDAARAREGRWGGLIASGWQSCALAMRLAVDHVLQGSESFGSPGLEHVKWSVPLRPGDVVMLTMTVLEARRSSRRAQLGVVRWRWELHNARGESVVELVATSLFDLGSAA